MAPCPVCLEDPPVDAVTLDCAHQLCRACLNQLEDRSRPTPLSQRCPTCRRPLPRVARAYARAAAAVRAADAAAGRAPLAEKRSLEAAVVALRVVVDVMPDHHDARFDLGRVLRRLGRNEDAVGCFARCARDAAGAAGTRGVGARALFELARAYDALGLHDKVNATRSRLVAECRGALRGSPGPAAATFADLLAQAGVAAPDADGATEALDDLDLCARYLTAGAVERYRAYYLAVRAGALEPCPAALADARAAAAALVPDAPRSDASDYASSASDDGAPGTALPPVAECRVASALALNGDAVAARAVWRALARGGRGRAMVALWVGQGELRAPDRSPARLRRATRALRRARDGDGTPAFAAAVHAKLGEAYLAAGDPAAAAAALRQAVALEPRRVASRLRLATALEAVAEAAPSGVAPYRRVEAQRASRAAGAAVARERAFRVLFSGELGLSVPEPAPPRPQIPDELSGGDAAYRAGRGRVVAGGASSDGKMAAPATRVPAATADRAYRSAVAADLAAVPAARWATVWSRRAREHLGDAAAAG